MGGLLLVSHTKHRVACLHEDAKRFTPSRQCKEPHSIFSRCSFLKMVDSFLVGG